MSVMSDGRYRLNCYLCKPQLILSVFTFGRIDVIIGKEWHRKVQCGVNNIKL